MSTAPALVCEQEGCPFAADGRCLEGLPNGEGCPHLHPVAAAEPALAATAEPEAELQPEAVAPPAGASPREQMTELGGEDSLSIAAADALAAKWGSIVTLIAGEQNAGKTTLLVELYAQFLKGPFAGWSFGGSDCLIALDRRYDGARGAGPAPPEVEHTVDEEMRLIDLRLRDATGRCVNLLLSDIKGEFVRQVIEGEPVSNELPLAVRADRAAVVIDGEKIGDRHRREQALTRARLAIGALTDPGGLPRGRPVAILLTKHDRLDKEAREWFTGRAEELRAFAQQRGSPATTLITAARPEGTPHRPEGLADVLAWLVAPPLVAKPLELAATPAQPADRSFWAISEEESG